MYHLVQDWKKIPTKNYVDFVKIRDSQRQWQWKERWRNMWESIIHIRKIFCIMSNKTCDKEKIYANSYSIACHTYKGEK